MFNSSKDVWFSKQNIKSCIEKVREKTEVIKNEKKVSKNFNT